MPMDPAIQQRLLGILSALPCAVPAAADQPSDTADAFCADCGQPCSWRRIACRPEDGTLRCHDCLQAHQDVQTRQRPLAILAEPFFYVVVVGLFAVLLWLLHVGNPSIADLRRQDADRPAPRQELGRRRLVQLERLQHRIHVLEATGRQAEVPKWATRAEPLVADLCRDWADTKVAADLQVCQAVLQAQAGDAKAALNRLLALESQFPGEHERRPSYLYHRGQVALLAGEREQCRGAWEGALEFYAGGEENVLRHFNSLVDAAIARGEKGAGDAEWEQRVRLVAGTQLPEDYLIERIVIGLRDADLKSDLARDFARRYDLGGKPKPGGNRPLFEKLNK